MIFLSVKGYAQNASIEPVRIMFYNVENLFDTFDDTAKDDNDFLPKGVMRWNTGRYNRKISRVYQTIIAAGKWSPPEVVAFCEVENRKVLEDIIYGTYLSKFNYRLIHEESPDERGIDVCMIFRKDCLKVIEYAYWMPAGIKKEEFKSRKILYSKILIGTDTIHLIVNHWPSRRGGVLAGEDMRMQISTMVKEKADSIYRSNEDGSKIIILGDFNSTPDDQEMTSLITPSCSGNFLVNLSVKKAAEGFGTYRYSGTWEMIDQVIVSNKLLSTDEGLCTDAEQVTVFRPDFLLMKDPNYPGLTPYSTYRGYRYQGGFSDHLPVILNLKLRNQGPQD
jgi:predicted extracellular nuclease